MYKMVLSPEINVRST